MINKSSKFVQFSPQKSASCFVTMHINALSSMISAFIPKNVRYLSNTICEKDESDSFPNNARQRKLWDAITPHLEELNIANDFHQAQHNNLVLILAQDDKAFLKSIDFGRAYINDEIGYIALNRLSKISADKNKYNARIALNTIKTSLSTSGLESLVKLNKSALKLELTKLEKFSQLHSYKRRVIWLGTARAVEAMIDTFGKDRAAFLDPAPSDWSWELNRTWLEYAVQLGFKFKLIEQHFPNVEQALLKSDPVLFLYTIANEVRGCSEHLTSQYSGKFSPTATTMEILTLLDFGCTAKRDKNGYINLKKKVQNYTDDDITLKQHHPRILKRSHSISNFKCLSPIPPLKDTNDHFKSPALGTKSKIFSVANITL